MEITIVQCPNPSLAKTNKVYVNENAPIVGKFIKFENGFTYLAESHPEIAINSIGLNQIQRSLHQYTLGSKQKFNVVQNLRTLDVVHATVSIPDGKNLTIDCEELEGYMKSFQCGIPLTELQNINFSYQSIPVTISVSTVVLIEESKGLFDMLTKYPTNCGILAQDTKFMFDPNGKNIKLKNKSASVGSKLFKKDLNLTELGIGGLDSQFNKIFRSAFASRVVPKQIADKMGLKHRKGVLLYGPPGTGKTLIARQIGKLLNCKSIRVISGPEVLNKYVGGSEENVRELFAEAELDRDSGEDSLHLIIFDEADALFKKRGSRSDNTGVNDNIVNQILAKIDGVDQLNNILIIAMTNRKDSIDEAILRSGRLDIHIEVGLPNESGRSDILNIHTLKLKDRLSSDVNLGEIAKLTKNYTGAELENIVTSATSFAITRELDMSNLKKAEVNPILTQQDFLSAIDDVPTLFGKISDEIKLITTTPFVTWCENLESTRALIISSIDSLKNGNNMSFLITGKTGIGKTKFLAHIIKDLNIACVKMISPEILLRTNNIQDKLTECVDACSRAEISVIFLDGFERLIKWSKYGYRYDNDALQLIMTVLRLTQNPDKKMIVFCTANDPEVLENLDIYGMFDSSYEYPEHISFDEAVLHFPQVVQHLDQSDVETEIPVCKVMKMLKHS
jgi:vesicle-fusing ATPase